MGPIIQDLVQRYITRQSFEHPMISHMKTWQDHVVVFNNLYTTLLKIDEKLVYKANKTEETLDNYLSLMSMTKHWKVTYGFYIKKHGINIFTD